jgi:hypothetical protein
MLPPRIDAARTYFNMSSLLCPTDEDVPAPAAPRKALSSSIKSHRATH